jgi:hypothetical protein
MGIKIEHIGISNLSPLQNKEFSLRGVNLFYGHNERGKTFLVEFLYQSLFKGKLPLRELKNASGYITLSGLDAGERRFSPASGKNDKKLEDLLPGAQGALPQDFSRLLVVKGGELDLSSAEGGVDGDILRQFLSGEALLDAISKPLTGAITSAQYADGVITGNNQGLVKNYNQAESKLKELDALIREVEEHLAAGEQRELTRQLVELKEKLKTQEEAKQHQAYLLDQEKRRLEDKQATLPEEVLSEIRRKLDQAEDKRGELAREKVELERNKVLGQHYSWLDNAVKDYNDLIIREQAGKAQPITVWLIVGAVALLATVLMGFLQSPLNIILSAVSALLAAFSFYSYFRGSNRAAPDEARQTQLKNIEAEFRHRFSYQGVFSKVTLAEKLETTRKPHFDYQNNQQRIRDLEKDLVELEVKIKAGLRSLGVIEDEKTDFESTYQSLKVKRAALDRDYSRVENSLARLDIPEGEYREQPAAADYDPQAWQDLSQKLLETQARLDAIEKGQDVLKARVAGQVDLLSTASWEDLLGRLEERRQEAVEKYRQLKAEIIAKIAVFNVLKELRQAESKRIDAGLQDATIGKYLLATTSHYNTIRREDGKLLVSDDQSEHQLINLSTGAREQVLLGLRLGFAARVLQGQPLFLLLDDAFQHSDWERRENLVKQMFSLADAGWQILYFSMDDNIRDLYQKYGQGRQDYQFFSLDMAK